MTELEQQILFEMAQEQKPPAFRHGYLYTPQPQVEPVKAPVKCDCGSEAAGLGDVHSDWCTKRARP